MNSPLLSQLRNELRQILSDPWQCSLVTWIPPVLFLIMWLIFSQGVATNIPVGFIDFDNSGLSRNLLRHYNASPSMVMQHQYLNLNEGKTALQKGEIYGLIVIPENMEKDIRTGSHPPQITAFVNTQFLLMGKVLNSALISAQATFSTSVEVMKNMASSTPVISMAFSSAMPVTSQVTPLFNSNKDYAQFLLAAIVPAIWQIVIVVTCILSLSYEQRKQGLANWLGTTPCLKIFIKTTLLTLFFVLQGILYLAVMYLLLGWPMHGSWIILIAAQFLTIAGSISMACCIFFLIRDPARSLSIAAAYAAPALAFMGVTFPVTDMTLPARIWRSLLPVCHYIEIQSAQVNYGTPVKTVLPQFAALTLFCLSILLVLLLAQKGVCNKKPEEVST